MRRPLCRAEGMAVVNPWGSILITVAALLAAGLVMAWRYAGSDRHAAAPEPAIPVATSAVAAPVPAVPGPQARAVIPAPVAVPPPRPEQLSELPPALRALAQSVFDQVRTGPTAPACQGAQAGLLDLLRQAPLDSRLWLWGMDRARDCLRAPTAFRARNSLLAALIEQFPDHPRVKELAGLQQYDSGDMAGAAATLADAPADTRSFEAWQSYADAQLALMRDLRTRGDPAWQDALARAEDAAFRALDLARDTMRPFALHMIARTQLEAGRGPAAVDWANQAVESVRATGSTYQPYMAADLYFFAGQIYYRAGQRDTGLAYMEQGISMAPVARQQADLRRLRDEFLRMYGG